MHIPCDCTERPAPLRATRHVRGPGLKAPPGPRAGAPPRARRPPLPCVYGRLGVGGGGGGGVTRGRGRREKERSRAVSHTPELDARGDLYDFGACNNRESTSITPHNHTQDMMRARIMASLSQDVRTWPEG
jgi:hypothetical protein